MKTPAILLIVVGIVIVIWGAFGFRTQDKVLDVGPIHATKETTHNVPYGPVAGAILAIGGSVHAVLIYWAVRLTISVTGSHEVLA